MRKDNYMVVKGLFWSTKSNITKHMSAKDIRKIDGVWTASRVSMTTRKRDRFRSRTTIRIDQVVYNVAIPSEEFTTQRMERGI